MDLKLGQMVRHERELRLSMLATLPIIAYLGLVLLIASVAEHRAWRRVFLRAALLWGGIAIVLTELLSLVRGITPAGLGLGWGLVSAGVFGGVARAWRHGDRPPEVKFALPSSWFDRMLWLGIIAILMLTATIAWHTPPQTWDSLNYHLARVAHWAQNGRLNHFATGIEKQNLMQPGAEMSILQFYVLLGGDRMANFVEWFAMVGSLIGVATIAGQLGGGRRAQLLSMVFGVTLPMGIAQASSTMTDYLVAFWVICVAVESLTLWRQGANFSRVTYLGLGAALALVTKLSSAVFLLPFALFDLWLLLRSTRLRRAGQLILIPIVLVLLVNSGYWLRNTRTYAHPFGPRDKIALHANEVISARVFASNLLRNAGLHAGTPWDKVNDWLFTMVYGAHAKLGLDLQDPRTTTIGYFTIGVPGTGEATSGNPLHAVLMLAISTLVVLNPKLRRERVFGYTLLVVATFLLYSAVFKWQVFGSRLHLPFFVLYAPIFGFALERVTPAWVGQVLAVGLLLGSWPWLTGLNSRPLIPNQSSLVGSVLETAREDLYFAQGPHLDEPYRDMRDLIQSADCDQVGVMLSGSGAEYPLWVLLGAPDSDLELEWIVSGTPSSQYKDHEFQPCAVVCGSCPSDWTEVRGLPLIYEEHGFRLFLRAPE